jgi:hypothetical protein
MKKHNNFDNEIEKYDRKGDKAIALLFGFILVATFTIMVIEWTNVLRVIIY